MHGCLLADCGLTGKLGEFGRISPRATVEVMLWKSCLPR